MKPKITEELLEKFYKGTCSKEEREVVWRWLKSHDHEGEVDKAMKDHWYELSNTKQLPETDFDSLYDRIYPGLNTKRPKKTQRLPATIKMAAVVTGFLLVAGVAFYQFVYLNTDIKQVTGYGESREIVLPDQSVITLNNNSTLTYARSWDPHKREVRLTGEGYFSIRHTEDDQRFVVHTDEVSIEVLGTEFNVHHRRGDTKVVLNSGKVALNIANNSDTTIIMSPGELVQYSAARESLVTRIVDPLAHSSWRNKRLTFNKTKLHEISRILEDDYGLTAVFQDSAYLNRELSGAISIENVDVFLNGLSESLDINIQRLENKVIFEK